ncbi:MAG: carboxypeptidase [Bacteroidota bacterium]|nr:carboxypeptidase [Bacteroidota bacterium]
MAKRLIVILSVLTFFFSESQSRSITDNNHLRELVALKGQARIITTVQNSKTIAELSRSVSISSVKGKSVEIVISPLTLDWFIAQGINYQIIESDDSKKVMTATGFNQAIGWDLYPTYSQYDSIMQSFSTLYPSLCHLDTIGTTINGKLVLALKISDNAGTDEDEPETFYSSTIHGDETGGFVLMLRLADYLLKNYPTDTRVTNLIDNLEIWINPLANPDGTYRNGDTIISPTRYNANGYDLNRNFPDPDPGAPHYPIQRETIDMIKFMRSHHFVLSANFHSGAEVVNYPWDRWDRLHADNDWFYSISRKYADTVHANSVPGYMTDLDNGITNGADWYVIYGGRQDFVTYELQGREVTIELDDAHITPAANLNSLWQYNWRSLLGYLGNALFGIHGHIKDGESQSPVPARIFITGYDKDSSHIYSDTLTGSFIRFLAPGTYNLLITANGYIDKTVNVVVTDGQNTELTIEMVSIMNPIDSIETPVLRLYPNPASDFLQVILPDRQSGLIHVRIYNMVGMIMRDYYENTSEKIPVLIDVNNLSGGLYSLIITNTSTNLTDRSRFVVVRR